ncbi:MAG: hypothetical protein CM15mP45_21770 [Deltaproteobacteria bacterium]|nr:MAG: hypothetical protein CM15mP45_21770 [Deltaproteobacteria bacterium]
MVEESKVEEDNNWFMPIIRYQVDILYVIAMACSTLEGRPRIKNLQNLKKKERTGEGSTEIPGSLGHAISMKKIFLNWVLLLFRIWAEAGLFMAESFRGEVKSWNLNLHFT